MTPPRPPSHIVLSVTHPSTHDSDGDSCRPHPPRPSVHTRRQRQRQWQQRLVLSYLAHPSTRDDDDDDVLPSRRPHPRRSSTHNGYSALSRPSTSPSSRPHLLCPSLHTMTTTPRHYPVPPYYRTTTTAYANDGTVTIASSTSPSLRVAVTVACCLIATATRR